RGTVHRWWGRGLGENGIEAGLDPRFGVLEDVLAVNLETEALVGSLQRLLTAHGQHGDDLRELVLLYGWRAVIEAVQHLIRTWEPAAAEAWVGQPAEAVAEHWPRHARAVPPPPHVGHLTASA